MGRGQILRQDPLSRGKLQGRPGRQPPEGLTDPLQWGRVHVPPAAVGWALHASQDERCCGVTCVPQGYLGSHWCALACVEDRAVLAQTGAPPPAPERPGAPLTVGATLPPEQTCTAALSYEPPHSESRGARPRACGRGPEVSTVVGAAAQARFSGRVRSEAAGAALPAPLCPQRSASPGPAGHPPGAPFQVSRLPCRRGPLRTVQETALPPRAQPPVSALHPPCAGPTRAAPRPPLAGPRIPSDPVFSCPFSFLFKINLF